MPPQIPENWKTLNVVRDLGLRRTDGNLVIHRTQKGSRQIYARWLPSAEEDPRPRKKGVDGKLKKRIPYEKAMGTEDPLEGAQRAVEWLKQLKKDLDLQLEQKDFDHEHSLEKYWKDWWSQEEERLRQKQTGASRIRDEQQKWCAPDWGVGSQEWSKKRIDLISYKDLNDYWSVLDARATEKNDMCGTKKQQKTFINKVFKYALLSGNNSLQMPVFPEIRKVVSKPPVKHLSQQQWNDLLKCIIDLSGGVANKNITFSEYQQLCFDPRNQLNQRNWVDLYDSILLLWFFHLRSTDLHGISAEMFYERKDSGGPRWFVELAMDKSARDIIPTTHYRDDAIGCIKRIIARKPSGHLCFPHKRRPEGAPKNSKVVDTANTLLSYALEEVSIDPAGIRLTEIRHTAFRLTLEERPDLGRYPDIDAFAKNGHTSAKMLQETYLKYISIEQSAKQNRITEKGAYTLVKRVGTD